MSWKEQWMPQTEKKSSKLVLSAPMWVYWADQVGSSGSGAGPEAEVMRGWAGARGWGQEVRVNCMSRSLLIQTQCRVTRDPRHVSILCWSGRVEWVQGGASRGWGRAGLGRAGRWLEAGVRRSEWIACPGAPNPNPVQALQGDKRSPPCEYTV